MADNGWIAIEKSTLAEYQKGASNLTLRGRLRMAMLEADGRITYNHSGTGPNWGARIREHTGQARTRGSQRTFESHDPWERLSTTWAHFDMTDLLTKEDQLENKGTPAIIKHAATIKQRMSEDMRNWFCKQLYQDGNAAANVGLLQGLLTMKSASSWAAATDVIVKPGTGTYGGKNVALGSYGGSWSSDMDTATNATLANDWPDGTGTADYDWNTMKLVAVNSQMWDTDSATDAKSNLIPAIRRTKIWCQRGGDKADAPNMCTLGSSWMNSFKNALDPKLHIWAPSKSAADYGFPDTLTFEGMEVQTDFDCASETGWIENLRKMEIQSMNPDLFDVEDSEYDIDVRSFKYALDFDGQVIYWPKFYAHLLNATAA